MIQTSVTRTVLIIVGALQLTGCGLMGDLFGGGGRNETSEVDRLAFVRESQIHTSWLRTARLETVTEPGTYSSPVWSPDGRKIAYIELKDGVELLSIVDSNGNNTKVLFEGDIAENVIVWTPAGDYLHFLSGEGGGFGLVTYTAMRVRLATGAVEPIGRLAPEWTHFRWSPLGDRLFYIALSSTSWDISYLGVTPVGPGSVQEDTRRDEIFPTVSPDGSEIAYVSRRGGLPELRVHNLTNGEHRTVVTSEGLAQRPPVWSFPGDQIAFVQSGQIWTVKTDGTGLKQLTNAKANYQLLAWSPAGNEIIYRANIEPDRVVEVSSEVYLLRIADGTAEEILDFGDDLDILWKRN